MIAVYRFSLDPIDLWKVMLVTSLGFEVVIVVEGCRVLLHPSS